MRRGYGRGASRRVLARVAWHYRGRGWAVLSGRDLDRLWLR